MNQASLDSVKATISTVGQTLTGVLDTVDPQFHVALVLGTAIAGQVPDLVNDVEQWIANRKAGTPSADEDAALATKIHGLLQPEGPGLA